MVDLGLEIIGILAQQVGEHVDPEPRRLERLGAPGAGQPDGQRGLEREREGAHRRRLPGAVGVSHRFPAPQRLDLLDRRGGHGPAVGVRVLPQHEVVHVPARGERHPGAALGNLVDYRPLFRDAGRMVQWRDDASRADANPLGHRGDGGARYGRIRIQAAELMKMTFRCPYCAKLKWSANLAPSSSRR